MVLDLGRAVREATIRLREAGVPSPETDAVALAAHALGTDVATARKAMILGAQVPVAYEELVAERVRRVPLQHLTGQAGFRRLMLSVGPGVFVPRPETELVVELALAAVADLEEPVIVDLCTGSGAIALAVADECPHATVYAVELAAEAHAWAVANRDRLGLPVDLRHGDATAAFPEFQGQIDVVVSNPPYIPEGMVPVDPEVRDHDPEVALYGGSADGLRIPLAVATRANELLRPGGLLVMEHADTQGGTLPTALAAQGRWIDIIDHLDLTGRPRVTTARRSAAE